MLHPFYSWLRPSGYSWAGTAYEPLLMWAPLHLFTLFHERQPVWGPSRCSVCFWLLSRAAGRTRSNALSMSCCSVVRLPYYAAHTKVRSPSQHVATALAAHGGLCRWSVGLLCASQWQWWICCLLSNPHRLSQCVVMFLSACLRVGLCVWIYVSVHLCLFVSGCVDVCLWSCVCA